MLRREMAVFTHKYYLGVSSGEIKPCRVHAALSRIGSATQGEERHERDVT